jgi:hypothetical protein
MILQTVNVMKILVAVMQLLSEDVRTDRQTDLMNLKCSHLKFMIQKVLGIIAALANHPAILEVTTISQLTLPLELQSTVCRKEVELDHSSHSYCTTFPHQPLFISVQNERHSLSTRKIILLH